MSVAGYLGKSFRGSEADRKDRSGVKETERVYEGVAQYDAVLRSHCGLDAVSLPVSENWVKATGRRKVSHEKSSGNPSGNYGRHD